MPMEASCTVADVHAHYFPADIPDFGKDFGDSRWPSLVIDAAAPDVGRILVGDAVFRKVGAPTWDLTARLAALDANSVGLQVVSPTPVMLTYWGEPGLSLKYMRAVNDSLAAYVGAARGRLAGLGTVPLQDVGLAVEELRRIVCELGLAGAEIGTRVGGLDLDNPEFAPFFDAAAELDATLFLHPLDGGGNAIRRGGQPYDFGLGMLTDTAMAAVALLSAGVLERHPHLRIGFAHGCGTMPWAAPRLKIAVGMTDARLQGAFDELLARMWVDTLVFDPEHLRLLVHRFGPEHVMAGTDYPFIPGQLEGVERFVDTAVQSGAVAPAQAPGILSVNTSAFVARRSHS
jgi:aminocarboxymuconate-semialdehyde decarboxylase